MEYINHRWGWNMLTHYKRKIGSFENYLGFLISLKIFNHLKKSTFSPKMIKDETFHKCVREFQIFCQGNNDGINIREMLIFNPSLSNCERPKKILYALQTHI